MMRSRPRALLCTATLLFAGSLTLQQCGSEPAAGEGGEATFKAVATVDQLMDSIVIPNAQAIWDSVVYTNGELVQAPKTDDDWYNLQMKAYAVAESGNLLMIAPRAKDDGDWMKFSAALTEKSMAAVRAAEAKDMQRLLTSGGEIYNVCTDCHRQYLPPDATVPESPIPSTN